ncbi:MAG: ParA family protein [Calditrichaceae bacterium]
MGEIIAITSQKGGVGKTTTSINLGASLAIFQKRVLLIDIDPQGSIAASFQLDDLSITYGSYDVFVNRIPLSLAIVDVGLDMLEIVPANVHGEEDEIDLFTNALQTELLRSVLSSYKNEYDYILLDCPPSLGTVTLNAITAADSLLIPVQCEYYSLKALGKFIRAIRNIGTKYNPDLRLNGLLITMFDKRLKKSKEIADELRHSFKDLVFNTEIPRNSKISEAPSLGKPVALVDISSPGAVGYLKLAEEIIEKENNRF